MNARNLVEPDTDVKLPIATSRVPAGLTAKR